MKLTCLFVLISLTLVALLSACGTPATNVDVGPPELPQTFSAMVQGMEIAYEQQDDIFVGGEPSGLVFVAGWHSSDEECGAIIDNDLAQETPNTELAPIVAEGIAGCFDQGLLGFDHDSFESYRAYKRAWSNLYIQTCGAILSPLGWPLGDGQCDVPDPRAAEPQ